MGFLNMKLCGRTTHSSGSCNAVLESLTFAGGVGGIVPSLPDSDCGVTQGMFDVFVVWGFVSSLCQILIKKTPKKPKSNECFCKAMPLGFFKLLLLLF